MHRRQFTAALTAPLLAPLAASVAPVSAPAVRVPDAAFVARLPRLMETAGVPGVGLCVVQGGRVVAEVYRGVADAGDGRPVSADTLWVGASLSKPVCAWLALRLADAGRLDLDRPLKQYVPDHAPADARGDRITARHVLAHASGLPNWRQRDDEPLVPAFDPGAGFRYSGEGFYYLQRALERIAGAGFEQVMQEQVFAPLGMRASTFGWRPDTAARLVTGHDADGGRMPIYWQRRALRLLEVADRQRRPLAAFTAAEVRAALRGLTPAPPDRAEYAVPNAASSLLTTPADYSAFLAAALGGGPASVALREGTQRAMCTPRTRVRGPLGWGLGWATEHAGGDATADGSGPADYVWHTGDNGSWRNFALAHPASRSALVVFTNGAGGFHVAQRVAQAATGHDHAGLMWR